MFRLSPLKAKWERIAFDSDRMFWMSDVKRAAATYFRVSEFHFIKFQSSVLCFCSEILPPPCRQLLVLIHSSVFKWWELAGRLFGDSNSTCPRRNTSVPRYILTSVLHQDKICQNYDTGEKFPINNSALCAGWKKVLLTWQIPGKINQKEKILLCQR